MGLLTRTHLILHFNKYRFKKFTLIYTTKELGVVARACNHSPWDSEVGVWGQPGTQEFQVSLG